MRILYLCGDLGIPVRGHKGSAVHVRALSDAFVRAGHAVTILTPSPGPAGGPAPLAEIVAANAPLPCGAGEGQAGGWPLVPDERALAYGEEFYAAARKQLSSRAYDFIYERYSLWSDAGGRLARASGLPLVLEVNAPLRLEEARYRGLATMELAAQIEAGQYRAAKAIAVVSDSLREYVVAQGTQPQRVFVLPNAVDPARFHPAVRGGPVRARLGLSGRIVVGFVGRPRPWHDLDTLYASFRQLYEEDPRYHLLLVGEVPPALPFDGDPDRSKDAVSLTGPVGHDEVPSYIAAMDVAVSPHPMLEHFYFSPLKLFEYLACAVPTVAARVGQPSALVRDGETGYLYPPGDAAALAGCIRRIVEYPTEARTVAWKGAEYVHRHHTWEFSARIILDWIQSPAPGSSPLRSGRGMAKPGWVSGVPELPAERPAAALPIFDDKLRHRLYRASRAELAGAAIARRLPAFARQGTEHYTGPGHVQVLKYKPRRRCVLAYELFGRTKGERASTRRRVVGKVFRDQRGERLMRLQQYLWDGGFGATAPDAIHVPHPLAYIPEMQMFVQEFVSGSTLSQLIPQADLASLVRRSAEALAKLHQTAVPGNNANGSALDLDVPAYPLAAELENLDRFTAGLAAVRPRSSGDARALYDALRHWAGGLPQAPPAGQLIHRDYYYSQVLFDGPRLTLIDFDLLSQGDPAIDVANFAAHLSFLALDRLGDMDALGREEALFVEAYERSGGGGASFCRRFDFYKAATFFRLMHVVAQRPALARHFDALHRRTARSVEAA